MWVEGTLVVIGSTPISSNRSLPRNQFALTLSAKLDVGIPCVDVSARVPVVERHTQKIPRVEVSAWYWHGVVLAWALPL